MIYRRIILILIIAIVFSSCMGVFSPISNSATSLKKGDTEVTIAGGMVKDYSDDENTLTPFPYISYQKKSQDDVLYEFYLLGIKRIDELYKGNRFYFAMYESVYAPFYIVGMNIGALMGYRLRKADFFLSTKVDLGFSTNGLDDIVSIENIPLGSYATSSGGLNFKNDFFIEFSISKLLYDYQDGSHIDEDSFFTFIYLGFFI